jgi:hypothetical protein
LIYAALYRVVAFLPDLSTHPFTLGWSEASRYYYASLFFAERLYGVAGNPSVLHPSRYLMQSVPFLIPASPLWLHRLWQVVLWLGTGALAGHLLARRLGVRGAWMPGLLMTWAFLFWLQGPVYYHLMVMAIAVLWGFDASRPWRTLALVALASAWAGISRINWFPVPGLLASALFLLERPKGQASMLRYLSRPFVWTVAGTVVAVGSQILYIQLSGNAADRFTTSFISDLLWYRLLPNPTFPLGVLPAILLASAPLAAVIVGRWRDLRSACHPIRLFGLGAILLVLFLGGFLVSAKIGGGSNLHNLDAYLTLLSVVGGYAYFAAYRGEIDAPRDLPSITLPVRAALIAVPAFFALGAGRPVALPDAAQTAEAMRTIASYAQGAAARGEEVLFISQRHLLTFGYVDGVLLVPEYETVFLMEMAMAGHRPYLDEFHHNLERRRYGLIVVEVLETAYKGRAYSFGEENDAWVREVSFPILCHYEPVVMLESPRVQLLVPRAEGRECPIVLLP